MTYLCVLVCGLLFAGMAMTVAEGLWNNALNFIAIVLSSTLAAVVGPPVGVFAIDKFGKGPESMWYFTFAGTWLVFFVTIMVFRLILERASKTRMKFAPPIEAAGGPLMGLLTAVMFASFAAFTLFSMPIRAGEWPQSEMTGWKQTVLQQGSSPFFTVLKAAVGEELANELTGA